MWYATNTPDMHQTPALHALCVNERRECTSAPPEPWAPYLTSLTGTSIYLVSNLGWVLEDLAKRVTCSDTDAQPDAFGYLIREHRNYLQGLAEQGIISPVMVQTGMTIWWRLSDAVKGDLAIPDAAPGSDGEVLLYIWKRGDHYLSLEMSEEGSGEFFYRNRKTGDIWGADFHSKDESVPAEIVDRLRFFLGNW